ncbi:hypothetical protein Q0F99_15400 [Rathayibacter oskolensis]|uniref:AlkA N-terminal domain-containing protein n=1 Tax=Rathayibacter oskolensis TaxID=1891671 RepID=UPI00265FF934|nr:AlkA N-terminal domain-containing protein [Rathayibacter oskolensis]WKK73242.1 hypothetical protein Q0F99_15400 [Rathayibacter oskolensis]
MRAPFDAGVLAFLGDRAVAGLEEAAPGVYSRALTLPGGPALARLELDGGVVRCTATSPRSPTRAARRPRAPAARSRCRLAGDRRGAGRRPRARSLVAATPGIRLPGSVDADETLVRTLLGQQVSVAAARTALGRLVEALGDELPPEIATGAITRSFPSAAVIAERGAEVLRGPRAGSTRCSASARCSPTGLCGWTRARAATSWPSTCSPCRGSGRGRPATSRCG